MAVYREGFHIMEAIQKASKQIFPDAADYGVLVKKNDEFWNMAKQLIEWYGDKETRKHYKYETGESCECQFTLIDEWAVSDGRKTDEEATMKFTIHFVSSTAIKNYDGIIYIS